MGYAHSEIIQEPVLTGQMAAKIVQKAFARSEKDELFVTITVVDRSGQTLAVMRHHNAGVHTLRASYKKAFTACFPKAGNRLNREGTKGWNDPGRLPLFR